MWEVHKKPRKKGNRIIYIKIMIQFFTFYELIFIIYYSKKRERMLLSTLFLKSGKVQHLLLLFF